MRLLLRYIHHFKTDFMYNMDHMLISGNEPSSVLQTKKFQKLRKWCPESAKASQRQNGWCNKPTKLQFQSICTHGIFMLSKRYESTYVDHRTWLHVPSGTHWSTSSDNHQVVEIWNKMYTPFSKEFLDNLKFPNFNLITNIKSFNFSTLYILVKCSNRTLFHSL